MDFRRATDVLTSAPPMTLGRIAEVFGKDTHTITRARMSGQNARTPPQDWKPVLAKLAREHAAELHAYALRLEQLAAELEGRE